jgi:NADH:ubiquinone oxidoreductase subunit 2 (subunit N)
MLGYSEEKVFNFALVRFSIFIGFSSLCVLVLINVFKFFEAILVIETLSFCTYFLIGNDIKTKVSSLESGVKYFCLGGLSTSFLFFSFCSFFYLMPFSLDFLSLREVVLNSKGIYFIFVKLAFFFFSFGVFFKLSIFPCHL